MSTPPFIDGIDDLVEIGRGGTATVYRGRQRTFGRTVAVKVLSTVVGNEQQRQRFERECLAIGSLSSQPHIVTVHSAGVTADGHPYLVMEYLPRSLADLLAERGRLPWEEACGYVLSLADAAAAAHAQRVIHRDIKPENVLLSDNGTPKLTDFGLAQLIGSFESQTNTVRASVSHASPEMIEGRPVTETTDVYSLASTLHHLIAGQPPFVRPDDDRLLAIIGRTLREAPPSLSAFGVPLEVEQVIARAMSKDAAGRPSSMAAFAAELSAASGVAAHRALTGAVPIVGPPNTGGSGASRTTRRRRGAVVAAAVVGLLGIGAVALAVAGGDVDPGDAEAPERTDATDDTLDTTPPAPPSASDAAPPAGSSVTTASAATTEPRTTSTSEASGTTQPGVTVGTVAPRSSTTQPTIRPATTLAPSAPLPNTTAPPTTSPPVTTAPATTAPPTTAPPTTTDGKVDVPPIDGRQVGDAKQALDAAGFRWQEDASCALSGTVVSHDPSESRLPQGSTITLYCG